MSDWQKEFPDYPRDFMPTIPEWFEDRSWHNDAMPSFVSLATRIELWVDFPNEADRENQGGRRFHLVRLNSDDSSGDVAFLATDDWSRVIDVVNRGTPHPRNVTRYDLQHAARLVGLDVAALYLQEIMGVTDGGFAGEFFDDLAEEWDSLAKVQRVPRLRDYVQGELVNRELEDAAVIEAAASAQGADATAEQCLGTFAEACELVVKSVPAEGPLSRDDADRLVAALRMAATAADLGAAAVEKTAARERVTREEMRGYLRTFALTVARTTMSGAAGGFDEDADAVKAH